jgi:hypothetical protein
MRGASRPPTDRRSSARRGRRVASAALQIACWGPLPSVEFSTAWRPHPNRQSSGVALEHRRFAGSQHALCSRGVVAITGFTAAWAGRISDDRRPTSTVERQTSWTTHELTSRRARNPAPRHPRLGAIGVNAAHVTPRKIHRSECRIHHRGAWIDCAGASLCAACHRMDSWWVAVARCVRLRDPKRRRGPTGKMISVPGPLRGGVFSGRRVRRNRAARGSPGLAVPARPAAVRRAGRRWSQRRAGPWRPDLDVGR